MHKLKVRRVLFSESASNKLSRLKGKTGITPNILCRLGYCLSLDEPGMPDTYQSGFKAGREINRYTLTGEYDDILKSLLIVRLQNDGVELNQIDDFFVAHMNRGVDLLHARVKSLSDLEKLIPGSRS